jgi:hypothetical protein
MAAQCVPSNSGSRVAGTGIVFCSARRQSVAAGNFFQIFHYFLVGAVRIEPTTSPYPAESALRSRATQGSQRGHNHREDARTVCQSAQYHSFQQVFLRRRYSQMFSPMRDSAISISLGAEYVTENRGAYFSTGSGLGPVAIPIGPGREHSNLRQVYP